MAENAPDFRNFAMNTYSIKGCGYHAKRPTILQHKRNFHILFFGYGETPNVLPYGSMNQRLKAVLKNRFLAGIIARTSLTWHKCWGRYRSIADNAWK